MKTKVMYLISFISITMILSIFYIGFRDSTIDSFLRQKESKYNVLVDSLEDKLYLIEVSSGKAIKEYAILYPEALNSSLMGTWKIEKKTDIQGGFGILWIKLNNGSEKCNIHGISNFNFIEDLNSHNCILMENRDILDLYNFLDLQTLVIFSENKNKNFE